MARTAASRIGLYVYALAAVATGVVNLIWGAFETAEEPIGAFGVAIPGERIIADAVAVALVVGGLLLLTRRAVRIGAVVLAVVYAIFAIFWLPRLVTAPHALGRHVGVYAGVLGGVGQQLILVAAAALVYAESLGDTAHSRRIAIVARWVFGLSSIDFGLAHLYGIGNTAQLVPAWMPLGGNFWAIVSGICFVLAGIGILTGLLDAPAAWLLGTMLLLFSAIVLPPLILAYPHAQNAWGNNAYNFAAVGAAWIVAGYLTARKGRRTALLTARS